MNTITNGMTQGALPVVLVDDEKDARKVLRSFISDYCPNLEIAGEASNVFDGFRIIRELNPKLVFLDIQLTDGTGFDLLDKFSQTNFQVIFTTAFDQFAVKAFKYLAVDYLLKPVDPEEFVAAVDRVENQYSQQGLSQLLKIMQQPQPDMVFEKIALPSAEGLTMMKVKDILRLESDGGYTTFFSIQGEKAMVTRSIGEFEDILPSPSFFRVHVSHLINVGLVKKYVREDGGYILMEDGSRLPIARRRKDEFLAMLRGRF